jgi:transposase-like protein
MAMKVKVATAAKAVLPRISSELLDQIVTGQMTQQGIEELMRGFKKALIERALGAEMSHHLGYASGGPKPVDVTNQRNGTRGKTVLTGEEALRIEIPRDRSGLFEPQLIGKHERRFTGEYFPIQV